MAKRTASRSLGPVGGIGDPCPSIGHKLDCRIVVLGDTVRRDERVDDHQSDVDVSDRRDDVLDDRPGNLRAVSCLFAIPISRVADDVDGSRYR